MVSKQIHLVLSDFCRWGCIDHSILFSYTIFEVLLQIFNHLWSILKSKIIGSNFMLKLHLTPKRTYRIYQTSSMTSFTMKRSNCYTKFRSQFFHQLECKIAFVSWLLSDLKKRNTFFYNFSMFTNGITNNLKWHQIIMLSYHLKCDKH